MKKCKNCKKPFKPRFSSLERFCWELECKTIEAMEKVSKIKSMRVKNQKRELKKKKESLETIREMMKRVQKIVNLYVRTRDAGKECCSCDKILKGKFDAGHFWNSNNHKNVTFDAERNIWGQCVKCNRWGHGSLLQYREKLLQRIGPEKFSQLEEDARVTRRFTKSQLQEILDEYKGKLKKLKLKD
jgi:hypothetical protein